MIQTAVSDLRERRVASPENILLNLDVYRKIDFRFLSLSQAYGVKQALPNDKKGNHAKKSNHRLNCLNNYTRCVISYTEQKTCKRRLSRFKWVIICLLPYLSVFYDLLRTQINFNRLFPFFNNKNP